MRDVEFMSGYEKNLILKQFKTFVKNGFQKRHFTKKLYNHLHLHCGFIAHYNIHGFYEEYFDRQEDTIRFIQHFTSPSGWDHWLHCDDYSDINGEMVKVLEEK